ncbi:hypothetical protein [Kribbella ginsengisoli]|uniref:Uncharacterized protein n=1 Tax=Kribbella ginsengisoli TaxID=363865 RepID=A0ABP6YPJ1_9ACTN
MSVTRALVGLYPPAVRERWGPELEEEACRDGWRGWPDLTVNLLGLWMHPAIWPAGSMTHRRARVAKLAIGLTGTGWLTGHALLELSAAVPRSLTHSWILDACDAITLLGFLLVLPLPRPASWPALAATAARRLPLLGGWWLALIVAVVQVARTVASIEPPPGPRRLVTGLWFATLGLSTSAGVFVTATFASGNDLVTGLAAGCGLVALALAGGGTIRDLAAID